MTVIFIVVDGSCGNRKAVDKIDDKSRIEMG